MKKILILILLLISIVTPTTFAKSNDCATVSTRVTFLEKNEYKLKLFYLGKVKSVISLSPGRHKLSAKVIYNKQNTTGEQSTYTLITNEEVSTLIDFEIDVQKNTMYQIIASTEERNNRKSSDSIKISIKKEFAKTCDYNEGTLAVKKPNKLNASNMIPDKLQYRLDLVMMDLTAYLQTQNLINKAVIIEKKTRILNTIGIVTNKRTPLINGINVLAITPYSLAAKIGLKPDDTILVINDIDLTIKNEQQGTPTSILAIFKKTIVNLSEDEKVIIEVIRNHKRIILKSDYKALSLPSYQVKIKTN